MNKSLYEYEYECDCCGKPSHNVKTMIVCGIETEVCEKCRHKVDDDVEVEE